MTHLLCTLGSGKGSWGHILRVMDEKDWESITIITDEWSKDKFALKKEVKWILINEGLGFDSIISTIKKELPKSQDIHINIISGDGKLHMGLLQALKESKIEIKQALITKDGLSFY